MTMSVNAIASIAQAQHDALVSLFHGRPSAHVE